MTYPRPYTIRAAASSLAKEPIGECAMSSNLSRRAFLAGALLAPAASLYGCGGGAAAAPINTGPTRNAVRQ